MATSKDLNISYIWKLGEPKQKDIINGYCKIFKNKLFYSIPIEINRTIFVYYYITVKFNTNKDCHSQDLVFTNNDKIVTKKITIGDKSDWCSAFLDIKITDKICDIYRLYLKWNDQGDKDDTWWISQINFAYITSTIDKCMKSWTEIIGRFQNQNDDAVAILVDTNTFFLFDKDNDNKELKYRSPKKFKAGDIFIMEFNFKKDIFTIYCNDIKTDTISLRGKKEIIPAVTITDNNGQIEIIKDEYIYS